MAIIHVQVLYKHVTCTVFCAQVVGFPFLLLVHIHVYMYHTFTEHSQSFLHVQLRADIGHVERQLTLSQNKHEGLKTEYTTFIRTLQETEQSLARANTV